MQKTKVLIVDDEQDVIAALQFRLTTAGYEVITAENGAAALEVIRDANVDLVLADFMMPEINGLELTPPRQGGPQIVRRQDLVVLVQHGTRIPAPCD